MKFRYLLVFAIVFGCQSSAEAPVEINVPKTTATLFGEGTISTDLYERDIAISPDGTEIIYTLGDYKQNRRCLVSRKKSDQGWGAPEILPFSGTYQDIEPFFAAQGKQLFFASNRPMEQGSERTDYNLWVVYRTETGWADPMPLGPQINTEKDEFFPSLNATGNLYFTATREDGVGREDIFVSKYLAGEYHSPVALDSTVNTSVYEFNAYINPTEDLLIFSAYGREDGLGGGDLYYSKKSDSGHWSPAQNLGPEINSDKLDYCPFYDEKENILYFTSERFSQNEETFTEADQIRKLASQTENGFGNIYWVKWKPGKD